MHHTKFKGDLGVLKAQLDLFEKGFVVCNPLTEHAPFDLVICKDGKCKTVQVKYRELNNSGRIIVKFLNIHSDKRGVHRVSVNKNLIDIYCVYCKDTDSCYYFNPDKFNKSVSIRVLESKNNQIKGVNFGDSFLNVPF